MMKKNRISRFAGGLCVAILTANMADATVTQVDGTIIPETSNLQVELDAEGETLNAILDAAELPEVFLPNLTQPVVFSDLAEGAGFENSFGWYNVGDDITTPLGQAENLHPIMGCGVPMQNDTFMGVIENHHHGNPAYYFQNAEPGDQISVDFAAEQAAGRYDGGFIGFYLITPEGGSPNCGDFTVSNSNFGFIYYTQKDLNNDGDFVHHLVYESTLDPDLFYFGFEDLFRGGDNDFEDMLIGVNGLTPPCIPAAEVCDGIDNDCDGVVDVADPDLTGTGDPCQCDNMTLNCADGVLFGECQSGVTVCVADEIQCQSTVSPTAEVCDLLDNNCNGVADDNPTDAGAACDGTDADFCPEGTNQCVMGVLVCDDNTGANQETCNGFDDDCDMATDESPSDEGGTCGSDVGECVAGTEVCVAGALECQGDVGASPETCDGLDNNCNGIADEMPIDVGQPCGATDVGECDLGVTVCNAGGVICQNEQGPTIELCDQLDNDCDGISDENPLGADQPCTQAGWCTPGTQVCTPMGLECQGGVPGTPEVCNGIDDDCNGTIDDNPSDVGAECGMGSEMCRGNFQCINGGLECVGGLDGTTETCNGVDDDCNGIVDDGDLCDGGECQDGQCSSRCLSGEFPCPVGQLCNANEYCVDDPCFGVNCPADEDGDMQVCDAGECVPVCDTVTCPGGIVCRPSDGACVPDNCHFLDNCEDGEVCFDDLCIADPCMGVSCPGNQFCREGDCVASCGDVECQVGEVCAGGACQATGCSTGCRGDEVCGPEGECIDDPCRFDSCPEGDACDPQTGNCVADPCTTITCPQGQFCDFGECRTPSVPIGDREYVTPGGGGCTVTGQSGSSSWLWLMLGAMILGLGTRRSRRWRQALRSLALAAACASLVPLASCDYSAYCVNCDIDDGDAGTDDGGNTGDGSAGDGGMSECDMGISRPEECDGIDNDCDLAVDEDFDTTDDILNCGSCDVQCILAGASSTCNMGVCEFIECFPGNVDLDGDTGGPYDSSTGCEYSCFTSNGGVEACDGLDNDCNGEVDEGIDLQTDDSNCGACGRVCNIFQASSQCVAGDCAITTCNGGFIDLDGISGNGCEYACTQSNGGVESCDLLDNDCDGLIDEDTDLMTDVQNCGACGNLCDTLNATPSCVAGACVFNPMTDCDPGYHDVNGDPIDGCEYFCMPSGAEVCDLVDNDCNGVVDDNPMGAGGMCNAAPTGMPTGECTDTGTIVCAAGNLVCVGAPTPQPEICDGLDNDCDGMADDNVERACYDGPMGTDGVGICQAGIEQCIGGMYTGICVGQVEPAATETCDNFDDDCDGSVDEDAMGAPITQTCYSGTMGTAGVGECVAGVQTCTFGALGPCVGEVIDQPIDRCGDGLDTDCDGNNDAAEGCTTLAMNEFRLDSGGGLGTTAGSEHSFDLVMAAGGATLGQRAYAAWADLSNGNADIYFRRSTDGGVTWDAIINLTGSFGDASVKPLIAVAPGATDTVIVAFQSVNGGVRDIRVVRSIDSGATFSGVSGRLDNAEDSFHHDVTVSANGTTVLVAWEELNTTNFSRRIRSRVSTDGGANFAGARTINVGSGGSPIAGRPQVAITGTGRFLWVWREIRAGTTNDVFAAFSDSDSAAINAGDETRLDADAGDNRDSGFPQLEVVGQNVFVAWQDITIGVQDSDITFVRSTNNGVSFGGEQIIDDPAGEVSESFTPTMAVDPAGAASTDDRVFLAWEDRRQGTQIFAAMSSNSGASFGAAVRASSENGDTIDGVTRNPQIIYAGNDVLIVTYTNDESTGVETVFAATSIDSGASWQLTHDTVDNGTGKSLHPAVIPTTGGGFTYGGLIGWGDFRSGTNINGDPYIRRLGQ